MPRLSIREVVRVAGGVLALAVAATWPVAREAARGLPADLGDPLLNTFILAWNADRFSGGLAGYWNAPFFFPLQGTLAFSEHLFGVALFTAPLQWLTDNPVLVYNVAWLASYGLAGTGMYVLARDLWDRRDAAWVAAAAFAFAPHRVAHASHLQVLLSGWMPVGLWCLHRYIRTRSRWSLAAFVVAFCLNGLSNGYFLYFFAAAAITVGGIELVAGPKVGVMARRPGTAPFRTFAGAAAGTAIIGLVLLPFAWGYLRVRTLYGFARGWDEIAANSASLTNLWSISGHIRLWQGWLPPEGPEFALFPGLVILVLAATSMLWFVRRSLRHDQPVARYHVALYGTVAVVAVWMAFGPAVWGPYRLLLGLVPGLDGLRVPARLIVVFSMGLAVLAGGGAAWFGARLPRRAMTWATVSLTALIVVEGTGAPVRMERFDPHQRQRQGLNTWLAAGPGGAVLELPVSGPALAPFTLVYQYNALFHGRPVVNGYSGYGSLLQDFLGGPASPLLDPGQVPAVLEGLRRIGVRQIVLHRGAWDDWPGWQPRELTAAIADSAGQIVEERYFTGTRAWRLAPPQHRPPDAVTLVPLLPGAFGITASALPERLPAAFDFDRRTRWFTGAPQTGQEWIRIEFARELDLGRIAFDMDAVGVGDYPRALSIEAEAADGVRRTMFAGSIVPFLIEGIATTPGHAPVVLDLPPNATRVLWIRQLGRTRTWYWGINEMAIFRR